jgi:hypothetical protein
MNCDTAFDLMTDAHGGKSQALRDHLEHCPRCRQMQETLAPALDWLVDSASLDDDVAPHTALAPRETTGRRMPALATAESTRIARESAEALTVRTAPASVRYRCWIGGALRCAALIVLGGFLALAFVPGARVGVPRSDDGPCRRHEAAAARIAARPAVEIQALVASCAACHVEDRQFPSRDQRNGSFHRVRPWLVADSGWEFALL